MQFEFDPAKSASNKQKHGLDFNEAQALWNDLYLLEIPVTSEGEPRFVIIGKLGEKYWSGVITYRQTRIRIISVRRSRKKEILLYENQ